MTKLSDTQRVILSAAAQHEMGLARAPKTLPAAARNAVFRSLIKNNLLTEINAPREHVGLGWRQDEDGTWIVARITDEGLRAIGIDPNEGDAVAGEPDCSSIEGSVPDTAPTVAPAAEPAAQDGTVAEAAQAAPLTEEIAMLDQALAVRSATPRISLRDAAAAVLAAWDDEANRATDMIAALDAPRGAAHPARWQAGPRPARGRSATQAAGGHEAGAGAGHAAAARGRHGRADRRGNRLGTAHGPRLLRRAEEEGPRGRGDVARADRRPQQDGGEGLLHHLSPAGLTTEPDTSRARRRQVAGPCSC